jgi:hypothetical protein
VSDGEARRDEQKVFVLAMLVVEGYVRLNPSKLRHPKPTRTFWTEDTLVPKGNTKAGFRYDSKFPARRD